MLIFNEGIICLICNLSIKLPLYSLNNKFFLISFSKVSFIPLISLIVSIQFKLNKQLSKLNESFLFLMYSIISVNILWDDSSSIFVALKEKINPSAKLI